MIKNCFALLLLSALLFSCASHTAIEPVGKGKNKVDLNLGGPIVAAFGTNIPVPYITANLRHGYTENFDINAGIHLFPIFYKVAGIELAASYYPVINKGIVPTVGIEGKFLFFSSLKSDVPERFRIYPVISPSFAWNIPWGMIYCGANLTLPFSGSDYDPDYPGYLISPLLGFRWNLSENYKFFTELKWHGANFETYQLATEYIHPGNHGALGVFFTLERSF